MSKKVLGNLSNRIAQLGEQLVNCKLNCKGICNNPIEGIIPKCLFFETEGRSESKGCVIVGINPGKSINKSKELDYYLKNKISYNLVFNFWNDHGAYSHRYYKFLRELVNCIGFHGPILWTELVKCENDDETSFPPLQTFRTCTDNYLTKELELVPENWAIVAVGREAHKALSYLYRDKSILGVPHPTSSRGNFTNLFTNSSRSNLKDEVISQLAEFNKSPGLEVWLSAQTHST